MRRFIRTYSEFVKTAKGLGLTLAQLNGDVPHTADSLAFMDRCGDLYKYERWVTRLIREGGYRANA